MADLDKILRLVAEGVLTAEEAEEIIAALSHEPGARERGPAGAALGAPEPTDRRTAGSHLRIEVSEAGRRVVNLRVPLNIAGLATTFMPGLSEQHGDTIRQAIASGVRGPILDIGSADGDRVLITTE